MIIYHFKPQSAFLAKFKSCLTCLDSITYHEDYHGERRLDPAYSSTIEIEKDEIDHSQEINLTRMNEQEASGGDPLVLVNPIVDAHFH